jgi:transcriptional regulator with XRE-family HTH domain
MKTGFRTHLKALIIQRANVTGEIITQKEIFEATGISQATLSRWHQGRVNRVDYDTAEKLAQYFGCKFSELVTADFDEAR